MEEVTDVGSSQRGLTGALLPKIWPMASFCRPRSSSRAVWSIEESALFSARKEFELLRLLATDKKAMAAARRLGCMAEGWLKQAHPQPQSTRPRRPPQTAPATRATRSPSAQRDRGRRRSVPTRHARPVVGDFAQPQPQTHTQHHRTSRDGAHAAPAQRPARQRNARQRRSADRSASRHARRLRPLRCVALALLLVVRLLVVGY